MTFINYHSFLTIVFFLIVTSASSPYRENSHSFSVPSTSRRDQAAQPLVDLSIDVNKLRTDRNRLRNDVEEQKKSLEILKTATRNEKKYADDQIQIAQKASTDITKFKNQIEELLIESTALTNKISTDTAQLESLKSETTKIKEDKRNQSDALQWFLDEIELKKTELNELHKQKDDMQINTRIQQIQHDVYVRVKRYGLYFIHIFTLYC